MLFCWFVDEYYRKYPGLNSETRNSVAIDGIKIINEYKTLLDNNFSNSNDVNNLVKNFTDIRFNSFYTFT